MVRFVRKRRYGGVRRRPRKLYRRGYKAGILRRVVNPTPTFVETFRPLDPSSGAYLQISPGGQCFTANIGALPQWAQYTALYNQYRINWAKVILVPDWDTNSSDFNSAVNPGPGGFLTNYVGMARIAYAIQDTPLAAPAFPANEQAVLTCNGSKIKTIGSKWMCSFKPVVGIASTTGAITKMRYRPFLDFAATAAAEPPHYGINAFISLPGSNFAAENLKFNVYYKVSFTLRDAK